MPELTASTREATRRLGVSDTAIHKAERACRIAREPDGQWDIDKTRRRLVETADPVQPVPISSRRTLLAGLAARRPRWHSAYPNRELRVILAFLQRGAADFLGHRVVARLSLGRLCPPPPSRCRTRLAASG
jgi:hypothetical protein